MATSAESMVHRAQRRVLLRSGALLGLGVLLLAALTFLVVDRARGDVHRDATARARVSITKAVSWPFYDGARDRQRDVLQQLWPTLAPAARAVTLDVPLNQSFVDVVVTAGSVSEAEALANRLADGLVDAARARALADADRDVAVARTQRQTAEQSLTDASARVDRLVNQIAAVRAQARTAAPADQSELDATVGRLEAQREVAAVDQDAAARTLADARSNEAKALAVRDAVQPEVEVIRRAVPDDGPADRKALPWLAAAVMLLLAGVGAVAAERELGRFRGGRQLRPTGAPVLGWMTAADATAVALEVRDVAASAGARVIAVVALGASPDPTAYALARGLDEAGYRVAVIGSGELSAGTPVAALRQYLDQLAAGNELVLLACNPDDLGARSHLRSAEAAVVCAEVGRVGNLRVRRLVQQVAGTRLLLGVVLMAGVRGGSPMALPTPAREALPAPSL